MTVAVIDAYAAPTIVYDVNRYSKDNGVPTFRKGQFKQVWAPGLVQAPPTTTSRAGTARRPSTSKPCTAWRPARGSCTWVR